MSAAGDRIQELAARIVELRDAYYQGEPLVADADDNFIRRFSAPYQPVAMAKWEVRERFGDNGTRELAQKVWQAEDFAFYRWFAMFPVLDHVENGPSGLLCANFVDLRFMTPGRDNTPFRYGLCSGEGGWRLFVPLAAGGAQQGGPDVVSRGEMVTITVRGSGFSLSRQGEALEAGAIGEWIRVKPANRGGEPLRAQVVRPGVVGMELP